MKLRVLVDNNTFIDQYYFGEPALSFYLEIDDRRILFDAGYSDIILKNAKKMGIDLKQVTHLVFSHGHNDHTRGLKYLADACDLSKVQIIAHPHCFCPKQDATGDIGAPYNETEMTRQFHYQPQREPYFITPHCCFLGQIPRTTAFENKQAIGTTFLDGEEKPDFLYDDTALVCQTAAGLFIITGCSHSGICNIIEYAKKLFPTDKIAGVIGGFHLLKNDDQLTETIQYLKQQNIEKLYPCHCVSLLAKAELMKYFEVEEVGVGLEISL